MLHTTRVGQGPLPMVFVHGLFGQGKNFGAIARGLNQRATSLLVDAPNHGLSPWTTTFDYGLFAEMLAETITTHCGDQPVVLAGHSMGAKIAMRLALDMPQMVDRLIVMDMAPARSGSIEEFAQIIRALQGLDLRAIDTRAQADQRLAGQIDNPAIRAFLLQSLQRGDDGWRWLMNLDLLGHSLDALADWPPTRTGS